MPADARYSLNLFRLSKCCDLIFETSASDGEVDQCELGLQLRLVVGVRQLGVEEQLEVVIVLDLLVAHLHRRSFLDQHPPQERIKNNVNFLGKVLNQKRLAGGNTFLHRVQEVLLAKSDDVELLAVLVLDPADALQLGVDHQRPLDRVAEDGGILCGHRVRWQTLQKRIRQVVRQTNHDQPHCSTQQ